MKIAVVPGAWEPAGRGSSRRPYSVCVWDHEPPSGMGHRIGIVQRKWIYTWRWEIKGEPHEYRTRKHAIGELVLRHIGYVREPQ